MAEMSVIWLRVAAALYSVGLLHSILAITQRRENLFRYALAAARAGVLLHLVSIIEEGLMTGRCPVANFLRDPVDVRAGQSWRCSFWSIGVTRSSPSASFSFRWFSS